MVELWTFLTAWYNLPFTALLGLSIFVAVLQLSGLGGDDDSHGDADADGDLDHDVDMDHDLDHDLDHDVDHDVDHGGDAGHGEGFSILSFIGVGKVPLLVVLLILFSSVGLLGWLMHGIIQGVLGMFPGFLILVTLPVATVGGSVITSRTARFIGQLIPPLTSTASRAQTLVGMTGTVTSPFVDEKYGMVHLRDRGGTLISLFCTTDELPPIPRGEQVLLVSYDPTGKRYQVTRK